MSLQELSASERFIIRRISGTSEAQCWTGEPLGAGVCVWPGTEGLIRQLCGLAALLALAAAEETRAACLSARVCFVAFII